MSATTTSKHAETARAVAEQAAETARTAKQSAETARAHRDALIRATGTGDALADRSYRSFAAQVGFQPGSATVAEDDLQGAYGLAASSDETYRALLATATQAAAAAVRAQAHAAKLGGGDS